MCYGLVQNILSSHLLPKNIKIKTYRTVIQRVVLYGCETLSVTLRVEHRLRVFKNRVLWKIFGPKRDEVTVDWRNLHNEELRDFYFLNKYLSDQIKGNERDRAYDIYE